MINQSIISLAILKVNWDVLRKDYLENFVPIVGEAIRISDKDEISVPLLQIMLKASFGLQIPQNTIVAILRRLRARGYIKTENKIYIRNSDALSKLDFHAVQQQVLRMHERLIEHLQHFTEERFQISLNQDEVENAFHEYIQENQVAITDFSKSNETLIPAPEKKVKGARYIVGAFIKHLEESQSSDFEYLETVVKGNFIANAIFITDPSNTGKKFRKTEIYFDTSFLIFALGYAGKARQDPCTELLDLLYKDNAKLRCFRHTLEEMRGVLDACANIIRQGKIREAYGPSIEYFIVSGCSPSDIEMFIVNLEDALLNIRIEVTDKPLYVSEYVIDEQKLLSILEEKIPYHSAFAIQRDVDSVAAIMRLRRGGDYFFVEECRALFITTNNALVRISREFFYEESPAGTIPPSFPDYLLTNLLWLKGPLNSPDLPKKRIIADYYAATQPNNRIWKSYTNEIDKLQESHKISSGDYYLLRYAMEAKSAFMDLTLGEEEVFSLGTINEILKLAREKIRQEEEREFNERLGSEMIKRRNAEESLSLMKSYEINRNMRISSVARRFGFTLVLTIKILSVVLLLIGTVSTFPWEFPVFEIAPFSYLISSLQLVLLIFSVGNLMFGTTLISYLNTLEIWMAKSIERGLLKVFG